MGSLTKKILAIIVLLLLSSAIEAEILTYTENTNTSNELGFGYPVPIPVDSSTAIQGFRSYASLKAQHEGLALQHQEMQSHLVGMTHNGREILAYTFGDMDNQTLDGQVEPAFLINGTIHAREWQSPEVVTELVEQLMERKDDNSIVEYLLGNTNIVILPVLNVDGFLQTQRFSANVTSSPGTTNASTALEKFAQPRDGRMRRKNMPSVDEDLTTDLDRLMGVDLNRNSEHFFGVQAGNADPNSLIYGGVSFFSEPETQALLEAAQLAPESRLRFYQDTHSFSRVLFVPQPTNPRRNQITNSLASKFQNVTLGLGTNYFPVINSVGQGIATTADYFAVEYLIPSWTLELEPPQGFQGEPDGGAFYGGTGISHSGFVMPDSAISRTRDQMAEAQMLMFYHQAGAASIKSVRIADANDQMVYSADWVVSGSGRSLQVNVTTTLQAGQQYKLWVSFNKPMRLRDNQNAARAYTGQSVIVPPSINLTGQAANNNFNRVVATSATNWLNQSGGELTGYDVYQDDSILLDFSIPTDINVSSLEGSTNVTLNIGAQDLAGLNLDANPATAVDWQNGAWVGYENSNGQVGDIGGIDSSYSFAVANGSLTLAPVNTGGSGGGSMPWLTLLLLLGLLRGRKSYKR